MQLGPRKALPLNFLLGCSQDDLGRIELARLAEVADLRNELHLILDRMIDSHVRRAVWHTKVGTPKTEQSERFVAVTDELREVLFDLWKAQDMPLNGYILAGPSGLPIILDNLAKRVIVPTLERDKNLPQWHGWYSLRRFLGTQVRMHASSETSAKALGNSKEVADRHYIRPQEVLRDVRKAVKDALSGLVN